MSALWLITTYFNPVGWQSRRRNYHTFRRHLGANLLTVEWSPTGNFTLNEDDADQLVRVSGGDLMWQKERLINIGLEHLPDDCELVGWVDCDILFRDPLWSQRARELLSDHDVVQLFGAVDYLEPEDSLEADPRQPGLRGSMRRRSLIQAWQTAADPDLFLEHELEGEQRQRNGELLDPSEEEGFGIASGLAWAARRAWLEDVGGLPDRAIAGSGVRHFAFPILGVPQAFANMLERHGLGSYWSSETQQWSSKVASTAPRIGHLDTTIFHLYHGNLSDRGYLSRLYSLLRTGFLPDQHLELDPGGTWRFNDAAPPSIREVIGRYFASRQEDGHSAQR